MSLSRQRYRKAAPEEIQAKKGDLVWVDFPPPCTGVLMNIFNAMDVRIECDKGDEEKVSAGIKEWINKSLLAKASPIEEDETHEVVEQDQENFIG